MGCRAAPISEGHAIREGGSSTRPEFLDVPPPRPPPTKAAETQSPGASVPYPWGRGPALAPAPHLVLPAPCSGRLSVPTSAMGGRTRALRARGLSRWHSREGRSREPNAAADLCFGPASSLTAWAGGAVTPRRGGESAERAFQHLGQGWAWRRSGDSTKPSRTRLSGGQAASGGERPTPLTYTLLRPRPPPCSSGM